MEFNNHSNRLNGHLVPLTQPLNKSKVSEILNSNGLASNITLTNQVGEKIHVPLSTTFNPSTNSNNIHSNDGASSSNALTLNIADLKQLQGLIMQQVKQIQMQQQQLAALLEAQQTIIENASLLQEQEHQQQKKIQNDLLQQILHKYDLTPKSVDHFVNQITPERSQPQDPIVKLEANINHSMEAMLLPSDKFCSSTRNFSNERESMGSSTTNDDITMYENLSDQDSLHTSIVELEEFARFFKKKRIELGFNQTDIGVALGKLYGSDFSQTTISRFEALNLSYKNMVRLKPLLDRFLADVNNCGAAAIMQRLGQYRETTNQDLNPEVTVDKSEESLDISGELSSTLTYLKKRKKRTFIENDYKDILENFYELNQRPGQKEIDFIAKQASLDKEVVKIWFGNRRQKDKKYCKPSLENFSSADITNLMSTSVSESSLAPTSSYPVWPSIPAKQYDYPSTSADMSRYDPSS